MKQIKKIVWKLLNKMGLGGSVQLLLNGALIEDGWFRSFHSKKSVDKNGNPVPWCSYPFIKFIQFRLKKEFDVFEYGCGNSTIWYAQRVKSIRSVEHDKEWFSTVKKILPVNAELIFRDLNEKGDYAKSILEDEKKYHLIVIDGRDRNNCAKECVNRLTENGVIVFDNTQEPDYKEAMDFLHSNGFKEIPFTGLLPIVNYNNTTSIFYRSTNCLAI